MEDKYKSEIKATILVLDSYHTANKELLFMEETEFVNETASIVLSMKFVAEQYYLKNRNSASVREADFIFLSYSWLFSTAAKVEAVQSESKLI